MYLEPNVVWIYSMLRIDHRLSRRRLRLLRIRLGMLHHPSLKLQSRQIHPRSDLHRWTLNARNIHHWCWLICYETKQAHPLHPRRPTNDPYSVHRSNFLEERQHHQNRHHSCHQFLRYLARAFPRHFQLYSIQDRTESDSIHTTKQAHD